MFLAFTPLVPKQSLAVFKASALPEKTLRLCEKNRETPRRPGFPFEPNTNSEKLQRSLIDGVSKIPTPSVITWGPGGLLSGPT